MSFPLKFGVSSGGAGDDQVLVSEGIHPVWSPDGEWIYYAAANQGTHDIFRIRPAPGAEPETVLGGERGTQPVWPRDNPSRFFYRKGREILAVDFDAATGEPSNRRTVFPGFAPGNAWDASSDGQRLLVIEPMGEVAAETLGQLKIVLN